MSVLGIEGERESGMDVRNNNSLAITSIANIVKTSLGPQGLDKMMVDDIGDVVITNDGATILNNLNVEHPAAKVLVELAQIQDREVGDGTTSVVILAAELLKRGNQLIQNKIHPTTVISGFRLALKESIRFIQKEMVIKQDNINKDVLIKCANTTLSSKLIGPEANHFSPLVVDAILNSKHGQLDGSFKYPVKSISILKCHGKSTTESFLVNGYAIQQYRGSQGMPMTVKKAKVACLDMSLNKFRLNLGVQVLVDNPENLEKIRQREMDVTKERCAKLIKAGANVIVCTKGIDEFAIKYFVEAGAIAIRRVSKVELRQIAKATGAIVTTTFADENGGESVDPSILGECEECCEDRVGDNDFIFFKNCKSQKSQTIFLRGANEYMLDEIERSVHDALCSIKRVLESNSLVVGGGTVEVATSVYLDDFARSVGSREQFAIAEFAETLNIIPKVLSNNAAKDASDLLSKLRSVHNKSQKTSDENSAILKHTGLDLVNGKIRNNYNAGVFEPAISKIKSLKFATEAAITILRIDDLIKLNAERGGGGRHP